MNHSKPIPGIVVSPDKSAYLYWEEGVIGMDAVDKAIGPAIAIRVNAGDKVNIETWARFERKEIFSRDFFLSALTSLLGGSFASKGVFEGLSGPQVGSNLNNALSSFTFPDGPLEDQVPMAYLNYIVYDENMVPVTADWKPVSDAAGFDANEMGIHDQHEHLTFPAAVEIAQDGYIYVWVSNQSAAAKVWFDDLTVEVTQSFVVQATDYGVWGDVIREQKTDESLYRYRYGYQGQFNEKDEETGWNHFELREYNPVIGRWTAVDPKRQFFSPYVGMGNNPIRAIDPDGGGILDIIFQNNSGQELGRIVTDDPEHEYINVNTDLVLAEPIIINPGELLGKIDAVGFGIEAGFTFGGGINGGFEWVYFLNGEDKGKLFTYGKICANLGLDGGAGVYGLIAHSNAAIHDITAKSWEGMSNSFSGGFGSVSGGYFWGNKRGTSELYPGHKGRTIWEGWFISGGYSSAKFGGKWSSTKYTLLSE